MIRKISLVFIFVLLFSFDVSAQTDEFYQKQYEKSGIENIEDSLPEKAKEYITENEQLEKLVFPRLIALSRVALGENNKPYNDFLKDVQSIKNQLNSITFCDEKDWTKPRTSMIYGWLKYVKENITIDFIKELIS